MFLTKPRRLRAITFIILLGAFLLISRWSYPERGITTLGFRALPDTIFSLGLWIIVWLICIGTGRLVVRLLFPENPFSVLEKFVFYSGLGFGIIGTGITFIGFAGLLHPPNILFWLVICALSWAWQESPRIHLQLPSEIPTRAIMLAGGIIIATTILQALTPPWDYDGLMYHLEGPRRFLEAGAIYYMRDIWQANGPFLVEMIFSIGLALQSDTFPKLIHLTFAILLILSTFAFSNRFLSRGHAWTAIAILLGIAILPFWASWAYSDFAWAFFDFNAFYLIALWSVDKNNRRPLILAGFFTGFALGTKYLAISGTFFLSVWIIWESRRSSIKVIAQNISLFLITGIALGASWWIKNTLLIGNPIFPFVIPTVDWDSHRISLLMNYLRSFGVKKSILDYLLLPLLIYFQSNRFGTFSQEVPSLLFPISLVYIFQRNNRLLNLVGLYAFGFFIVWALGSQQVRFLLPIFPGLSILTSWVLLSIPSIKIKRIVLGSFVGGLILTTIVYQISYLYKVRPIPVLLGLESKEEFLMRNVFIYKSYRYIEKSLPSESKILMLWDGQSYYCRKCLPDTDQTTWINISDISPTAESAAFIIKQMGASYVLFSGGNFAWFQLYHNPNGGMDKALQAFAEFARLCGREIYNDGASIIYEIQCQQ